MFRIPDIVSEHLAQNAVGLVPSAPEADATTDKIKQGHYFYIACEVRQAIVDKDIDKVKASKRQNVEDLKANIEDIRKRGEGAWVTIVNASDNVGYKLNASDGGWMWCYVIHREDVPTEGNPTYNATVTIGSYSKTAKQLSFSVTIIRSIPAMIPTDLITSAVSYVVGKFISRRADNISFTKAAEEAVREGAEALEKVSKMFAARWAANGPGIMGCFVGGFVNQLVLHFIANYKVASFGLDISVYNWSKDEEWNVLEYYGSNTADLDPEFTPADLPVIKSKVKTPKGIEVVAEEAATSYAVYTFTNSNTTTDHVGAGLKLVSKSDSSRIIYIKYLVSWEAPNKLGLGTGASASSLADYYNTANWDTAGNRNIKIQLPAGDSYSEVSVQGMTEALSGESNDTYYFRVDIGDVPTTA